MPHRKLRLDAFEGHAPAGTVDLEDGSIFTDNSIDFAVALNPDALRGPGKACAALHVDHLSAWLRRSTVCQSSPAFDRAGAPGASWS